MDIEETHVMLSNVNSIVNVIQDEELFVYINKQVEDFQVDNLYIRCSHELQES